jgi:hypothetical protein
MSEFWMMALGLGMAFQGALIIWVGGLPRALTPGETLIAEEGTPAAAGLFWLDQYSYIGLTLLVVGTAITIWGYVV